MAEESRQATVKHVSQDALDQQILKALKANWDLFQRVERETRVPIALTRVPHNR